MKPTIHIGWLVFFAILIILATYIVTQYINEPSQTVTVKPRKEYDVLILKLPNSHNPDVFGPKFWEARHKLAEMTPCPACRVEAVSHEKFFHDYVNAKTEKKMKYPENFKKWQQKINDLKS